MLTTFTINSRRYLGNKFRLLPFIRKVADEHCPEVKSVFDGFAGTGAVASAFLDKRLVVNDLMESNYLSATAWFAPLSVDEQKIATIIEAYNRFDAANEQNYFQANFANTYFSENVCRKIGYVRDNIEALWGEKKVNYRERAVLITSLIYAIDHIAHTCGHYDAFIDDKKFPCDDFAMGFPALPKLLNPQNECRKSDINALAGSVKCDLVYLDPPYNSRQYCDTYHLLENIALWQKPKVSGKALKMDRSTLKSDYCTTNATQSFAKLIDTLNCKYILLSYNNTGQHLNSRSNARISDEAIMDILQQKGRVTVFDTPYRAFNAGKGLNEQNKERLFLCRV